MIELEPLLQEITALTPFAVALVALAGLVVGIAPSSFPLMSVAAGLATGQGAADAGSRRIGGFWLSVGFVLGIATVDAVLGALFGLAGFAVMRILARYLALAYDPLMGAVLMATFGLARGIPIVVAATMAGGLASFRHSLHFTLWAERIAAALMFAAALYFLYQAALYAG